MTTTHQDRLGNTTEHRHTAKQLREMFDVIQEEIARKAGISGSKLSLYENGFVDLTDAELRRLEKVLNALPKKSDVKPMPSPLFLITGKTDDTFAERYAAWSEKKRIKARRSLRRQVKLTQIELAREIGIPRKKLIHWETGRLELSDAEFAKWQQVIIEHYVAQKKADPWARLEVRIQSALNAHEGKILDHPLIMEIMESFRRESETLEEQLTEKTSVTSAAEEEQEKGEKT